METLPCTCVVSSRYHVESCNFSPNGKLLAACFGDFTVRLLRIGEQRPILRDDHAHPNTDSIYVDSYWVIKEHKSSVWCARFSPNSLLLCTCSSDKTAKIWNVNSQTLERSFDLHTDTVWSCCFTPANSSTKSLIATGSSDQTVKVWNTVSGKVVHDLGGYGDAIDFLDFSSSGEILCTSCRNGVVKIWTNLSFARTEKVFSECNTDSSVPFQPICLDLVAVNRCASRFCMFAMCFSSYVKDITDNEAATSRDVALSPGPGDEVTRAEDTQQKDEMLSESNAVAAMDLFPNSDPCELLFAGGPENSFAVWSLRDIAAAFKNMLTEDENESTVDINQEVSSITREHPNQLSQKDEDEIIDDHLTDSGELRDSVSMDYQMDRGTQLSTVTEEEEEAQSDLAERMEHEDSRSQITDTSQETHSTVGESSFISDEPFSFYKVEPTWILTDHLSTVWDCCTATLLSSNHDVMSEGETAKSAQVLISCSGDRTLRYENVHTKS